MLSETKEFTEAHRVFRYDEETGTLYRKQGNSPITTKDNNEYLCLTFNHRHERVHRIIWLMCYGYYPEEIDHINGDPSDNRLDNLRAVTRSENILNGKVRSTSVTGITGVSWDQTNRKWRATITWNGKQKSLGRHKRFEDAVVARYKAEREIDWYRDNEPSAAARYVKENALLNKPTVTRKADVVGVSWDKQRKKWLAYIRLPNGKSRHLGRFDDFNAAVVARYLAECDNDRHRQTRLSSAARYVGENGLL